MTDASNNVLRQEPIMGILKILPCGCRIAQHPLDILCQEHAIKPARLVPDDIGLWWRWNPIIVDWETEPVIRSQDGSGLHWNWTEYFPVKDDGLWGGRVNVPTWIPKEKP